MTTWGIDVSHFQNGLSLASAKQQGYDFVIVKASEGVSYKDASFRGFVAAAEAQGMLVAAYHFLHSSVSGSSVAAQADNCAAAVGDKNIPVMIDAEPTGASRPSVRDCAGFKASLVAKGFQVPGLYLPPFYWAELGHPSLAGWTVWAANYGRNPAGHASAVYPGDTSARWNDYGGAKVQLLQFDSQDKIDGFSPGLDADAFRGTRAELAATGWFHDPSNSVPVPPPPAVHPHPHIIAALASNAVHARDLAAIQNAPGKVTAKVALAALAAERASLNRILGK